MTSQDVLQEMFNQSILEGYNKEQYEIICDALEEIQKYRKIGSVEQCKKWKEKDTPKKPIETPDCVTCDAPNCTPICDSYDTGHSYRCSNCDENGIYNYEYSVRYKHCPDCGQKINWEEI